MEFIPYSCQVIEQDDIDSVVKTLKSDYLTQGPLVAEFESNLSSVTGVRHAVALSSGTAALHLGMLALGINENSLVWTTPITFVATANAALYCGASIDFVDVEPLTANISISALEQKLDKAEKLGKLPTLLAPVHFSGATCKMAELKNLSLKYGFLILEDAAHALGANYADGSQVGNCKYSDLTILSFHAVKSITTAEGGACLTNHADVYQHLIKLRTHGITRDKDQLINNKLPSWHYEQQLLGYHYRLTEIQAALGISQLKKLGRFIGQRKAVAVRYQEKLLHKEICLPPANNNSAWHLYSLQVPANKRDQIFQYCSDNKIGTNTHYQSVHLQPYYQKFKYDPLPNAERYASKALSIPIHPNLSLEQQDFVVNRILEVVNA